MVSIRQRRGSSGYWKLLFAMPRRDAIAELDSWARDLGDEDWPDDLSGIGDLVSVTEIAQRAGTTPGMVHSWRRRHPDFPPPVAQLAIGPVWDWPPVAAWLARPRRTGRPRKMGR